MEQATSVYYKRDFWADENLKYRRTSLPARKGSAVDQPDRKREKMRSFRCRMRAGRPQIPA